jgi:hypothetical protein
MIVCDLEGYGISARSKYIVRLDPGDVVTENPVKDGPIPGYDIPVIGLPGSGTIEDVIFPHGPSSVEVCSELDPDERVGRNERLLENVQQPCDQLHLDLVVGVELDARLKEIIHCNIDRCLFEGFEFDVILVAHRFHLELVQCMVVAPNVPGP